MAKDQIRYDVLAQDALRGMLRKLLTEVAQTGLPGEHHFYVTFTTHSNGVRISNRLREQYPEEMTIVLQHQFWDLKVAELGFEIGLSFNGIPERLHIPFASIKAFFDPSVQFGLQFDPDASAMAFSDPDGQSDVPNTAPPIPLGNGNDDEQDVNVEADNYALDEGVQTATDAKPLLPSEREKQRLSEEKAAEDAQNAVAAAKQASVEADSNDNDAKSADVVSLDAFRKKN